MNLSTTLESTTPTHTTPDTMPAGGRGSLPVIQA